MKVQCFLDDEKKTKACTLEINSVPSLDMGFPNGKKYYQVSEIFPKGKSFEFIVREIQQ